MKMPLSHPNLYIGAGVGATPFTSVLESMPKKSSMEDRCVDFHWIVGNQQAERSWFPGLLQSIEDCSSDLSIRVTIWYTGGKMLHSATQKGLFAFSNFSAALGREARVSRLHSNYTLPVVLVGYFAQNAAAPSSDPIYK
jgi:ferredoxin-NADP reductase